MAWPGMAMMMVVSMILYFKDAYNALRFKKIEWKSALAFQYEAEHSGTFYMGLNINMEVLKN